MLKKLRFRLVAVTMLIVFAMLCRSRSLPGDVPLLWGVLAVPMGLICSRLLFCQYS